MYVSLKYNNFNVDLISIPQCLTLRQYIKQYLTSVPYFINNMFIF